MFASRARHTDQSGDVIGGTCLRSSNRLGDWDRAIVAGEAAVKINPH